MRHCRKTRSVARRGARRKGIDGKRVRSRDCQVQGFKDVLNTLSLEDLRDLAVQYGIKVGQLAGEKTRLEQNRSLTKKRKGRVIRDLIFSIDLHWKRIRLIEKRIRQVEADQVQVRRALVRAAIDCVQVAPYDAVIREVIS